MERINPFGFYDLGKAFKSVEAFHGADRDSNDVFWVVMQCRTFIGQLLDGKPIPIGISRSKALSFSMLLDDLWEREFTELNSEGTRVIKFPGQDGQLISRWALTAVMRALSEFETVFAEEMRETATYFVPRRGIYSTPALVDSADETFPADLVGFIPQKTRNDWKAAGRCLAFNLLSASGFHVARAVEGTLEAYYQLFSGKPGDTLNNWHDYKKALDSIVEKKANPTPQAKTIAELDQMRTDYRNPIVHPRVVLSEADARMLFANGESLIIAMAQEIAEVRKLGGVQLSLAEAKDGTEGPEQAAG